MNIPQFSMAIETAMSRYEEVVHQAKEELLKDLYVARSQLLEEQDEVAKAR